MRATASVLWRGRAVRNALYGMRFERCDGCERIGSVSVTAAANVNMM